MIECWNLMMDEHKSSEECKKSRVVLGDVTNKLRKRGISSISSDEDAQSEDKNCENLHKKEEGNSGTKYARLNEKDSVKRACLLPRPSCESSSIKENAVIGDSRISNEIKDPKLLDSGAGSSNIHAVMQVSDESRSSGEDGTSTHTSKSDSDCVNVEVICDSESGRVGSEDDIRVSENEGDDHGADNLIMSQTGSADCARFPESQESQTFELERCSGLKTDGCFNSTIDVDVIKSCSCSFCAKAGYVWLDLHYQDMKGRLAALKKVQKDASVLVERSCRTKATDKHAPGSSQASPNLEHDLMVQWRTLFLRMREMFEQEGNQLESNLQSLKDLRDRCKTELEAINGKSPANQ